MGKEKLPRIDSNKKLREKLLAYCRLSYGEVWEDKISRHKVGCLDAGKKRCFIIDIDPIFA